MRTISPKLAWFILLFCCLVKLVLVVQDFTQPTSHRWGGDVDAWPNMAYFFYKNLHFFPFPQLDLISDQMLYPFGNNHVFQDLTLEFNYFYSFFYHFLGPYGPWTSLYFVASNILGVSFSFWLLKREYSVMTAFMISFLAFFFDFYAIFKFSGHLVHAAHHWLSWSIITDLILFHRIVTGKKLSFPYILLKCLVILGSLGQEVAYLAGFSLMSTTVFLVSAILLVLSDAELRTKWSKKTMFQHCFQWTKSQNGIVLGLILLNFLFIWAYIPLILQIVENVNLFKSEPSPAAYTWSHPLKIFVPLIGRSDLVGLPHITHILGDRPEFFWDYLTGWTLLGILIFAFWHIIRSKQRRFLLPIGLLLALCLLYHPTLAKTLHIFPWFKFNRNSGRSTLIFSTLIPLLLVFLPWKSLSNKSFPWITLWMLIGFSELVSVYAIRFSDKPYRFDSRFQSHMNTIKNSPGKVVLDYPFCIIGGNGIGYADNLCPCYIETNNQGFMAHYHEKFTVSYYYGRLFPSMIEPFVRNGWGHLMVAEKKEGQFNKLTECPSESKFQDLEQIVKLGDFAGIQVYENLLPSAACLEEFKKRFGESVSSSQVPGGGLAHFIPKKKAWQAMTNENALKSYQIKP